MVISDPYYAQLAPRSRTMKLATLFMPLYNGAAFIGTVSATLRLDSIFSHSSFEQITPSSFTMILDIESGLIIDASQSAYDLLFCPQNTELCTLNGGDTANVSAIESGLLSSPLSISSSSISVLSLGDVIRGLKEAESRNHQQMMQLTISSIVYTVSFSSLASPFFFSSSSSSSLSCLQNWIVLIGVPLTELASGLCSAFALVLFLLTVF